MYMETVFHGFCPVFLSSYSQLSSSCLCGIEIESDFRLVTEKEKKAPRDNKSSHKTEELNKKCSLRTIHFGHLRWCFERQ